MEKRKSVQQLTCKQPDRHCPELMCGYPLPCPWHTVIIDLEKNPPTIEIPITAENAKQKMVRIKELAIILGDSKR